MFTFPEETPAQRAERRRVGAQCGHVTRRLLRDEPLKGKVLEFALSVVGDGSSSSRDELRQMAQKLKSGTPFSEYEKHIMIDVLLLHTRLGMGTPINANTVRLMREG